MSPSALFVLFSCLVSDVLSVFSSDKLHFNQSGISPSVDSSCLSSVNLSKSSLVSILGRSLFSTQSLFFCSDLCSFFESFFGVVSVSIAPFNQSGISPSALSETVFCF
jgi:hypothetical protein